MKLGFRRAKGLGYFNLFITNLSDCNSNYRNKPISFAEPVENYSIDATNERVEFFFIVM